MKYVLFLFAFSFLQLGFSQTNLDLEYYLPQDITYDSTIPTPEEIIGHPVGEWHVTHDKLIFYMQTLAMASDRISIENRGKTFEGRPLLLLTVTSPENHQNIDRIREEHVALTENEEDNVDIDTMPLVIYQGFSIHGNEPSGANAGLAYAYYLAAAQGDTIESILENTVILMDPAFNPDGLQRFAHWANTNKSTNLNSDSNDREFHESWPRGRTNHYWFDLNRDWLPVQLPESRVRIASFHKWMPNILTDHHEMGTNSTFFFQPGESSRVHPLTPELNQRLTTEIGTYHAKALDSIGSLYYSEEDYDDFYYGKGSTYPDINGGIGILFEQASSRGHIQNSENGVLSFPFTIRNQLTTALSTLKAGNAMRVKILEYQRDFFRDMGIESAIGRNKAILFGDSKDASKAWHFADMLQRQNIKFHDLATDVRLNGINYKTGYSYVIPKNQKNYRMINAMFEKRTSFTDSIFYDISAWTLPLAFNLDYTDVPSLSLAGNEITELSKLSGNLDTQSDYAYLFEWNAYYSPKALNEILNKGIRAKVAKAPFSIEEREYDYGTIMIPVQQQILNGNELHSFLKKVATESNLEINGVRSGRAKGIDLGSNAFDALKKQKVALLVGGDVRSYDAGEIWHLFDRRYDMNITKIDTEYFNSVDLNEYTDLIIPSMGDSGLSDRQSQKLRAWVKQGGTLIGYREMVESFAEKGLIKLKFRRDTLIAKNISFQQKRNFEGAQVTGGAIFEAKLDLSHPINFGYKNNTLPLFRDTNIYIEPDKNSYNNPIQYTDKPLMSGYISEENLDMLKNSVPFQMQKLGKGRVMIFTDNTNFRAFWYGTTKLLMNAIFFGDSM